MSMTDPLNHQRFLSFINKSGDTIPPYGVIQFRSDADVPDSIHGYKRRLVAIKPDGKCADSKTTIAFNSGSPVLNDKYGNCTFAVEGPAWARLENDSGDDQGLDLADANYDWLTVEFGPKEDRWDINSGGSGYMLQSAPDLNKNRVLVRRKGAGELVLMRLDSGGTDCLGPRDWGGVKLEMDAWIATNFELAQFDLEAEQKTASGRYFNGLVEPGQLFTAISRGEKYFAVSDGFCSFRGVLLGDIGSGPNSTVSFPSAMVSITGGGSGGTAEVECHSLFNEFYPEGTAVHCVLSNRASWTANNTIDDGQVFIWITNYDCGSIEVE